MAVDKSRIHQEITIGRTFRQRERRLKDYDLNGPGSLSPILERLESCCREWCSLMRRWRGGDVWEWKEKARRGRRLISRDTTSSTPKPSFSPLSLTKRLMISSDFRLHTQIRPLEKITSLGCSKCSFILIIHFLISSRTCSTPLFHTFLSICISDCFPKNQQLSLTFSICVIVSTQTHRHMPVAERSPSRLSSISSQNRRASLQAFLKFHDRDNSITPSCFSISRLPLEVRTNIYAHYFASLPPLEVTSETAPPLFTSKHHYRSPRLM